MRAFIFMSLLAAASSLCAQGVDPLHSPQCDDARAALERALDDAAAHRAGAAEALSNARRAAIEACLGREDTERQRSGAPYPTIAVRPPVIEGAPALPVPPAISRPQPLEIARPSAITTCDPGGCWDSAGRRLPSVGPMLVGPHGPCVPQPGVASCP